jgi:hypothetical protein
MVNMNEVIKYIVCCIAVVHNLVFGAGWEFYGIP